MATATAALLLGAAGCSGGELGTDESFEAWNDANDPAYVDANFEYAVARLPVAGQAARRPIPADYWATYQDSVNYKWDGFTSDAPTTKYAKAFGREGLERIVSEHYGVERHRGSRKACFSDFDCDDLNDGSVCGRHSEEDPEGVCIPTWWGICHGWAPYAISEAAAIRPVEHNGVTFYPGDIEALFSLVYTRNLPVKFLSERCNEASPRPDEEGRIPVEPCRDMNPGTLHIVATNLLGLREQGFVEDRTYDLEVWNHPVSGFRVANLRDDGTLREITEEEAVGLLGLPAGSEYHYNTRAQRFFHVLLDLDWITEATPTRHSHVDDPGFARTDRYEYILEADAHGVVLGGEYLGESRTQHPDFVWWPTDKPQGSVADGLITYDDLTMLNAKAQTTE